MYLFCEFHQIYIFFCIKAKRQLAYLSITRAASLPLSKLKVLLYYLFTWPNKKLLIWTCKRCHACKIMKKCPFRNNITFVQLP